MGGDKEVKKFVLFKKHSDGDTCTNICDLYPGDFNNQTKHVEYEL